MGALDTDADLIATVRQLGDAHYDRAERLLRLPAQGSTIHSAAQGLVHPHRPSVLYALATLRSGSVPLAEEMLQRIVDGQDADVDSPTYGTWSYVAEEPPAEMRRPDPNYADFIGQDLALVLYSGAEQLDPAIVARIKSALGMAAEAIIRRNVSMAYTNIAAMGTFVTLAAGELLRDDKFIRYGRDRIDRFAAEIERSGSFYEYNSPTYWLVMCKSLTAINQFIADPAARAVASSLTDRLWRHLAQRWHGPTGQLSGPMSRAYHSDMAEHPSLLAFVAKALGHRPPFDALPGLPSALTYDQFTLAPVAVLEPQPPGDVVRALTGLPGIAERHELFSIEPDVVGTTWLGPSITLGSVNQADGWVQRRNLLGFWRAPGERMWEDPVRHVRVRVVKDGVDFVSGVFSSVQAGCDLLWHVGFASPGGDHHVVRNVIERGQQITMRTLRVSFEISPSVDAAVEYDGRVLRPGDEFALGGTVLVRSGGVCIGVLPAAGGFGDQVVVGRLREVDGVLSIDVDLLDSAEPAEVDISSVGKAYVAGGLTMCQDFDVRDVPVEVVESEQRVDVTWQVSRELFLSGLATPATREEHASAHRTAVDGDPVPKPRLSSPSRTAAGL